MNKKGKTNPILAILVVAVLALVIFVGYMAFKPVAEEVIPTEEPATAEGCLAIEQAKGKAGEAATVYAYAYDGAPDNVATQRASTAYMWRTSDPTTLVSNAKTLSASDSTAISGFNRGDVVGGVSFDSTYYGVPVAPVCVDGDSKTVEFRVYRKTDAIKVTFKGNDSVTGSITDFAGVGATETIDEVIFEQNQTDDAYRFAGFHIDFVASSNATTATISSADSEWSDTAARTKADLSNPATLSFSKHSGSPFGSNNRRDIADVVFETDPIFMLENDQIVAKNLIFSLDADRCGTSEDIGIFAFDKGHYASETNQGIGYGYETDATTPADAGVSDANSGSFKGTLTCTAS